MIAALRRKLRIAKRAGWGFAGSVKFAHLIPCLAALLWLHGRSALAQIVNAPPTPEWIQHPAGRANQSTVFEKAFTAATPLLKSILLGACDGRMAVQINGASVGEISGRERTSGLDVTKFILPGENALKITALNPAGAAKIAVLLEMNGDLARQSWIVSDTSWKSSAGGKPVGVQTGGRVDAPGQTNPFDPQKAIDSYNSWKLALGSGGATPAETLTLPPGFKAELLRSATAAEGSWIAMAFDPQGRLTVGREKRGLLRMRLGAKGVEDVDVIDDTLLECRGLAYAHGALYANANNSKGLYRLRDTDGDGRFDETTLLLHTDGGVGHGRNRIVPGPDGSIWLVHGNNVQITGKIAANSPLAHYGHDALIPCPFDDAMFDGDCLLPAGHVLRMDPDGKTFELYAGGFRNPFEVAFNRDGEMFTFDADMEWDVGAPWYRPNRVNHVVSGADFGWRRGTSKWPDYFPDTLPSTLDIGLASPTAVKFGATGNFPDHYAGALFIADWAYGRVLAVHLQPNGASYSATSELFVSGRPLNVTDIAFGPEGAMYLITGGRGTQSGLYRITHTGAKEEPPAKSAEEAAAELAAKRLRALRRELEAFHKGPNGLPTEQAVEKIWPNLGHPDVWIRHAARVALEHQDSAAWRAKALREETPEIGLTAWLALARAGTPDAKESLLGRILTLPWNALTEDNLIRALRTLEVVCARMGEPTAAQSAALRAKLEPLYPATAWRINHQLCAALVYLKSEAAIPRTLALLAKTDRSEDMLQYLFYLRYLKTGWSEPQRKSYFEAFPRAEQQAGAREYFGVLKRVRDEAIASLTDAERNSLGPVLSKSGGAPGALTFHLPFVREWRMEDFALAQENAGSAERGKAVFAAAQCLVCHRFGNRGGFIGPDLTAVGSRFDRRALLESILEPSKVIDDKFRNTQFFLKDDNVVTGLIEREDADVLLVRESPIAEKPVSVLKKDILKREPSAVSPMPAGLANSLQREQILDLLAYLQSGAAPAKTGP